MLAQRSAFALSALLLGAAGSCSAEVIFDNIPSQMPIFVLLNDSGESNSGVEGPGGVERDSAVADRIQFAGAARRLSRFEVAATTFTSNVQCMMDLTLTLYADGGGTPGAVLWSGTAAGVSFSRSLPGTIVAFTPDLDAPDAIYFGLSTSNFVYSGNGFGPGAMIGPATIGSTAPGYLLRDSATGVWGLEPGSDTRNFNLAARVTAIPGPGAGATGLLLLASGVVARQRGAQSRSLRAYA